MKYLLAVSLFLFGNPPYVVRSGKAYRSVEVFSAVSAEFKHEGIEEARFIALDKELNVVCTGLLATGDSKHVTFNSLLMFHQVTTRGGSYAVLAHNHPSTYLTPSETDIKTMKTIQDRGCSYGVYVLDSLIVSPKGYLSMRDFGVPMKKACVAGN